MTNKQKLFKKPSLRVSIRYGIIATLTIIVFAILIPTLLNYGPESINTDFDIEMSYIPYWAQLLCIIFLLIVLLTTIIHFLFKSIDKFYMLDESEKYNNVKLIKKVRKKCFSLPYLIPLCEAIIPSICTIFVLLFTGNHHMIMVFKILILVFSFSLILAISSFIFSKKIYNEILTATYKENINIGLRINLKFKILLQIIPLLVFSLLIQTYVGFTCTIREKEDLYFNLYNEKINSEFDSQKNYTPSELYRKLEQLPLLADHHSKFIIKPDNSVITLNGETPSNFVVKYTIQIAQKYNGRTYDSYGLDAQGKTMKISTTEGDYYIGVLYTVSSNTSLIHLCISAFFLFTIAAITSYMFSSSLSKDIIEISGKFNGLCKNNFGETLPITSNDEIGDLIRSFNSVQKYSKKQLALLKDNQEILMEQERLATLGQMVGGIAHNLKTPIMSISGATEGLKDLISEYNNSIGDNEVTNEDHHEIAAEMKAWVDKIDTHTSYMSDVITTVKGQAVTLSNQDIIHFTIEELIKRVNILMKHELKHSLTNLNILINDVNPKQNLKGDINSLIQVLNNLISNAIHSYDGNENNTIDLIFNYSNNNLIISVKDYGKGIPENIQRKLFKEMVTTKGKNGTGLGLFMSYSNIRAHFNGNISFDSVVGKGTTFNIILPINQNL